MTFQGMDSIADRLDDLFEQEPVVADPKGYLTSLAGYFGEVAPRLLFFANEDGRIEALQNFESDDGLSAAKEVAEALRPFSLVDKVTFAPFESESRKETIFSLRIVGSPVSNIFLCGALSKELNPHEEKKVLKAVLKNAGKCSWAGLSAEVQIKRLEAKIRQLSIERETLMSAHTEATVNAIEEQQKRLREERQRMAVEQICAATEAANNAKSQFLANMSHEIRTPLNAILGFTELLRKGADENPAERKDFLDSIYDSGKHLLELINDVLDLSKIEAGRMQIEKISCSPHEIAASVLSLLRVRASEKGLWLKCEWPVGVPASITTDSLRLKQLLMNLVGNAIKFTQRGGVRIVCWFSLEGGSSRMTFDVIDTGVGIPPQSLESIFDAFVQADSSVTRNFGGTGLGLAISRKIARALGGDIAVKSEVGRGSVFTASIDSGPLKGVDILPEPTADAMRSGRPREKQNDISLIGSKVLLVEDGLTNQKLISLVLRKVGAEVEIAENGRIGADLAMQKSFDVILMDMQMPILDGYAAAAELRSNGVHTPIIALTAHAMAGDERKCLRAGCNAYLVKPVDADRLISAVAEAQLSMKAPFIDGAIFNGEDSASVGSSTRQKLYSTLPVDDPDFREIVEEFVEFLKEYVSEMRKAYDGGDYQALAVLAHTLKGTAGTAGYRAFNEPTKRLEMAAKSEDENRTGIELEAVERLASAVAVSKDDEPEEKI